MVIAGGALLVVVIAGIVVALVLPRPTAVPSSISQASSSSQPTAPPTSSATARPSPSPTPTDKAAVAQPKSDGQPADAPAAPPPAAPPAPADPGPPALPPPPAPIITPTITTFTASNYNNSSQTIAQGCATSPDGTLSVQITWATENTLSAVKFRTQISGSPPIDTTITGYPASGNNHRFQMRCAKIAYVTMTFRSNDVERQARLTIDGNGPAGWSYLN